MRALLAQFKDRSFVIFLVIGVVNVTTGVFFSSLWALLLQANLAFVIGYVMSLSLSYLLNSYFAFKESLSWRKYTRFCLSYLPNFLIQNVVVFLVYNRLGFSEILAYLLAAAIGVPITYLMIKLFAFIE